MVVPDDEDFDLAMPETLSVVSIVSVISTHHMVSSTRFMQTVNMGLTPIESSMNITSLIAVTRDRVTIALAIPALLRS